MDQTSMPLAEKLDAPLAELFHSGELAPSARVPVIVRCGAAAFDDVAREIALAGGTVRGTSHLVGAIAAWIPMMSIGPMIQNVDIAYIELQQDFTLA